jgi:hypothetical protein
LSAHGQQRPQQLAYNEQTSAISSVLEDAMTSAAQAFLLTAGLFGLSFFAIFAIWYAERLRFGTPAKLPL